LSACERLLRHRLRDGGLPRPGKPVQPVDGRFPRASCPEFDLIQNGSAGSLETTVTVPVSIFGLLRVTEFIQDNRFGCGSHHVIAREEMEAGETLTWILSRNVISFT
jgi:hypothetical protein